MSLETIIAIDLGKFKSVVCVMDAATRQHRFETIATTPAAVHELLARQATKDPSRMVLIIEACDAAGWVHDLAVAVGLCVKVANCCHEAWKWKKVKRKTDTPSAATPRRTAVRP